MLKFNIVENDEVHNPIGFEVIEVIAFNFNGKGETVVLNDGRLEYLTKNQTHFMLFDVCYKLDRHTLV